MEILALILINVILYFRTIWYDLCIDDVGRFKRNIVIPRNKFWQGLVKTLHGSGDCLFDYRIEHVCNIIIHTTVSILVYLAFGANLASFIAAALFSVHPVNNQVSMWLNGKRYGISTILVLLMYWAMPFGIVFYFFTPFWQVNAVTAPLLYIAKGHTWALAVLPLFFLIGKGFIIKRFMARYKECNGELKEISLKKLVLYFKTFGYYLRHCLVPVKVAFFHTMLKQFSHTKENNDKCYALDGDFVFGILSFTLLVVGMLLTWGTPIGIGLFWFLIFISPFCNLFVNCIQLISERYVYLANVGLMVAVGYLLVLMPEITIIPLVYYIVKTILVMPMYDGYRNMLEYNLRVFPAQPRVACYLSNLYEKDRNIVKAIYVLRHGLRYTPHYFRLNTGIAHLMMHMNLDDSIKYTDAEISHYIGRAEEYMIEGRESVCQSYCRSLRIMLKNRDKKDQFIAEALKVREMIELPEDIYDTLVKVPDGTEDKEVV